MAIVIQNLANVVNVLDTTKTAGEQIIQTISKTSVAKGLDNTPFDIVQFMDSEGDSIYRLQLDGLVEYQDIAGVPTLWVGTLDAFINKINSEYFVQNGGSLPTGASTAANQQTEINLLTDLLNEDGATKTKQDEILTALGLLPKAALGTSSPSVQVTSSVTEVTLMALNTNRKELKIVNNGTSVLYIAESAGASLTNWAWRLEQNEMAIIDKYSGIVTGIWDVANGFAQVTETT